MRRAFVIAAWLLLSQSIRADDARDGHWWMFEDRRYYPALIAGVRDPHLSALALGFGDRVAFQSKKDSPRRIWDIDAGAEIPLFGWENYESDVPPKGSVGVGLWIPVDFHVIEDFADRSAPIVNTDYRFGGMIKLQYGLMNGRRLSGRLHVGHESTHIGDEFTINARREFRGDFERINVSWEYLDLGVMYDVPRHWNVRGGVTATLPFGDSYYFTDPDSLTESPRQPVTPSENWWDPYAGFEVTKQNLIPATDKREGYDAYASVEMRWRSVYDYHKADPGAAEERQASFNVIVGIKLVGNDALGYASPFIRYYRGVNPHGQFRNQKDYTEYGIGLRLVR